MSSSCWIKTRYVRSRLSISFLLLIGLASYLSAQQEKYKMKGNDKEATADFLFSYYEQDGNNAAVTGGIGTEKLEDIANLIVLNIPLDSTRSINGSFGADFYSSASTDNIDNNVSSASAHDLRIFLNLGYAQKNLRRGETYGIGMGVSREYDYTSFSVNANWAKEFNQGKFGSECEGSSIYRSMGNLLSCRIEERSERADYWPAIL